VSQDYAWWIDGKAGSLLQPTERVLQYGDGLFETMRICNRNIEYLDRHLQRLRTGCERLAIGFEDWLALEAELNEIAQRYSDAVLKLLLCRTGTGRGYAAPEAASARIILSVYPPPHWPAAYATNGISVRICDFRLASQPRLAGIKHLNRLEQVLARQEWRKGYEEGLLLDYNDRVIEGTMSNIFLVDNNRLLTPALDSSGVSGVMRSVIIDLAAVLGMSTEIRNIALSELMASDETFICNSLIGIWPIAAIDDTWRAGAGPVTAWLQAELRQNRQHLPGRWYVE
jgi:4-amino-4-deoxychorismate lyase